MFKDTDFREEEEDLTYGDIVWTQFTKNRVAYYSLWAVGMLFVLAICCPIIASGRPFIWIEDGQTSSPWLISLFDRNYYENAIDIFFNLLLILGTPLFVGWLFRIRMLGKKPISKRPRRRQIMREGTILFGFLMLVFVGMLMAPIKKPYVQYKEKYEKSLQVEEASQPAAKSITAVFAPLPYSFRNTNFKSLEKPSAKHWIGIDSAGRDVTIQMLYGIRISLSIGIIAVGIYVTLGILIGSIAGYFGGRVDMLVQRVIEIFMSVPTLIVLLVLIAFIERPSIYHIMLVIGLFRWTGVARLVRGEFFRLRNLDFVTSAVALGFSTRRIIFQHILPNALGPVLVAATFGVAGAILTESSLSFLGLGDVSVPSWGQTLSDGYKSGTWHLILAPGFAIFITVSLLNLVGEGLRDALDPKMRK